jgi:hypothetical protein
MIQQHLGVPVEKKTAIVAIIIPSVTKEPSVVWLRVIMACVVR